MAAGAAEEDPAGIPLLKRTCHLCEEPVESHVWYARTVEVEEDGERRGKRVYACPSCYFELDDDERALYYRERV